MEVIGKLKQRYHFFGPLCIALVHMYTGRRCIRHRTMLRTTVHSIVRISISFCVSASYGLRLISRFVAVLCPLLCSWSCALVTTCTVGYRSWWLLYLSVVFRPLHWSQIDRLYALTVMTRRYDEQMFRPHESRRQASPPGKIDIVASCLTAAPSAGYTLRIDVGDR